LLLMAASGLALLLPDYANAAPEVPATLNTIVREYNTAASANLVGLEADFNNDPSALAPIIYLDYDKISTWYGLPDGPRTVDAAIGGYLTAKTGRRFDAPVLALLARAMNSLDAEGIVLPQEQGQACFVVPQYPGISFHSAYRASFKTSGADLLRGKTVTIGMTTQEFGDFVNAHESWHCLDERYIKDTGDGLAGAVKRNRSEMFADIGSAMEAVRKIGVPAFIDKAAAMRATWAYMTGPLLLKTREESANHYDSIVYTTQDGLYALKARIRQMGMGAFLKLNRRQLRKLNYELTDAHCITYAQAQGLQIFYASGKTEVAVQALLARMNEITLASVRPANPREFVAREESAKQAAADGGLTTPILLAKLRVRAGQIGNAESFRDQLKARQEMTDSLRTRLRDEPASEIVTEAQLKLLLYTNPRLVRRK
jgi:hypothetical protein